MLRETNLFGAYLPPLLAYMAAALLLYLPVRAALVRLDWVRHVWNPPLAETAMYVCILGALVRFL